MELILDNLFFITISLVLLITMLISYIKVTRSGKILSKHHHKTLGKFDIAFMVIAVFLIAYFERYIMDRPLMGTYFFILYMGVLALMNGVPILVTEKGFFFKAQFIKWSSLVELSVQDKDSLYMKRLTFVYLDVKIKEISNIEAFLETAYTKCNLDKE